MFIDITYLVTKSYSKIRYNLKAIKQITVYDFQVVWGVSRLILQLLHRRHYIGYTFYLLVDIQLLYHFAMIGELQMETQAYRANNFNMSMEQKIVIDISQEVIDIMLTIPFETLLQLSTSYDTIKQNLPLKQNQQLSYITQYFDNQIKKNHYLQLSFAKFLVNLSGEPATTIYQQYSMWYQMLFIIYISYLLCPHQREQRLEFIFNEQSGESQPLFIETKPNQFDLSYVYYGMQKIQLAMQVIELIKFKLTQEETKYASLDEKFRSQISQSIIDKKKNVFSFDKLNQLKLLSTQKEIQWLEQSLFNLLIQSRDPEEKYRIYLQLSLIDVPLLFSLHLKERPDVKSVQNIIDLVPIKLKSNKSNNNKLELIVSDKVTQTSQGQYDDLFAIAYFDKNLQEVTQIVFCKANSAPAQICQIEIEDNEPLAIPKSLFFDPNIKCQQIYFHNLFSYKINDQITKLQPKFDNMSHSSGFAMVNDIFKQLKSQKISLIFDFNLHIPIKGKTNIGNDKYIQYYQTSLKPVQLQGNLQIYLDVPEVLYLLDINEQSVQTILLNYRRLDTIKFVLQEIHTFVFKYQPFGIFLEGLFELDDILIKYLDKLLFMQFYNIQFYANLNDNIMKDISGLNLQKIKIIAQTKTSDVYKYSNSLRNIIQFTDIQSMQIPILYQTKFITQTINNIGYFELTQKSKLRHQMSLIYQTKDALNINSKIVNYDNQFEKFFISQLRNKDYKQLYVYNMKNQKTEIYPQEIEVNENDSIVDETNILSINSNKCQLNNDIIIFQINLDCIGVRFILINLSDSKQLYLFKNLKFDPNQTVKLHVITKYYMELHDDMIYIYEYNNNNQKVFKNEYQGTVFLSNELQNCLVRLDMQSITVIDVVYSKFFEPNQKLSNQYTHIYYNLNLYNDNFNDQYSHLKKAFLRFCNYIIYTKSELTTLTQEQIQYLIYNYAFNNLVGIYLMIQDLLQRRMLYQESQFGQKQFNILKLTKQQFSEIYNQFILQQLMTPNQAPLKDVYMFGLNYSELCNSAIRAASMLFPAFLQDAKAPRKPDSPDRTQTVVQNIQQVFDGKFQIEVLIVVPRISEKIAILATMLGNRYKVVIVSPIYETSNGIELTPEHLLGVPVYQNTNLPVPYLGTQAGLHMTSAGNVVTVYLHNFQFFYDRLQLQNDYQQALPFQQMLREHTADDGAEVLLQRALLVQTVASKCLEKQLLPPKAVICQQAFSIVSLISLQQILQNTQQTTQIQSQIQVYQQPKYFVWESKNHRNVFENKNDLHGYRIHDMNYTYNILVHLQIQENKVLDSFHRDKLFVLRGGLQLQYFITNYEINEAIQSNVCLNWIQKEPFLVNDDILSVLQISQYIADRIK